MIEIPLTKGQVTIVDDCDADLAKFNWYATETSPGEFYAVRKVNRKTVALHREVLKTDAPQIDHRNGNKLDNRRENLRPATHAQNLMNRDGWGSSGFKGVHFCNTRGVWMATICLLGKRKCVGKFDNPVDAAHAYDAAALSLHGEFARFNFEESKGRLMYLKLGAVPISLASFDGEFNIKGTPRAVAYAPKGEGEGEDSVLVIKGLTPGEALQLLYDVMPAAMAVSADEKSPEQTKPAKTKTDPSPKAAEKPEPKTETKVVTGEQQALPVVVAQVHVVEKRAEPETPDGPQHDFGLGIDVEALSKMTKLRPVIEHFIERGHKTVAQIVKVADGVKASVPALLEVDKKGNFAGRIERAATVVMGGETAA